MRETMNVCPHTGPHTTPARELLTDTFLRETSWVPKTWPREPLSQLLGPSHSTHVGLTHKPSPSLSILSPHSPWRGP